MRASPARPKPWSTNFDIYSVPADGSAAPKNLTAANQAWDAYPLPSADGKTLYYLAMKRPTFEADRFGIMALDLASGQTREIDPKWDRSAGALQLSKDGKTLFTSDRRQRRSCAVRRRHRQRQGDASSVRPARSKASAWAATTSCSRAAR